MRLGLLGFPIDHSQSPDLYRQLLKDQLDSYELFSYSNRDLIPPLEYFAAKLNGLNITSPFKEHFFTQINIESEIVKTLGAVNTLAFTSTGVRGTNTDLLAVMEILNNYQRLYSTLNVLLFGNGVMARITKIVATSLQIPVTQFFRKANADLENLDLAPFHTPNVQNLVINACSRDFVFKGNFYGDEIFWDYNYSFLPHQTTLPLKIKSYHDGREMLILQARAAINFWLQYIPKLN